MVATSAMKNRIRLIAYQASLIRAFRLGELRLASASFAASGEVRHSLIKLLGFTLKATTEPSGSASYAWLAPVSLHPAKVRHSLNI